MKKLYKIFSISVLIFLPYSVLAWSGPSAPPPGGNSVSPLNSGPSNQKKNSGTLWLDQGILTIDAPWSTWYGTTRPDTKIAVSGDIVAEKFCTGNIYTGAVTCTDNLGGGGTVTGSGGLNTIPKWGNTAGLLTDSLIKDEGAGGKITLGPTLSSNIGLFVENSTGNVSVGTNTAGNNKLAVQGDTYVSGKVGIGTTDLHQKLTINGNIGMPGYNWQIQTATDVNWGFGVFNSGLNYFTEAKFYGYNNNNRGFRVYDVGHGTVPFFVGGTGKVGIGTVTPGYTLDVNGDIKAVGYYGPGAGLTALNASNITAGIMVATRLPALPCTSGSGFIKSITEGGVVACASAGSGTITGVTAGSGLTGGGTSGIVTLSVPNLGITNAMLAGGITNDKISEVSASKITNFPNDSGKVLLGNGTWGALSSVTNVWTNAVTFSSKSVTQTVPRFTISPNMEYRLYGKIHAGSLVSLISPCTASYNINSTTDAIACPVVDKTTGLINVLKIYIDSVNIYFLDLGSYFFISGDYLKLQSRPFSEQ